MRLEHNTFRDVRRVTLAAIAIFGNRFAATLSKTTAAALVSLTILHVSSVVAAPAAIVLDSQNVVWGVTGHNDHDDFSSSYIYNAIPLEQQIGFLTSSGLRAYRTGCQGQVCDTLIALTSRDNILFLKALALWPNTNIDETANYQYGYDRAFEEATKYKGKVEYYEASNELDNWVGTNGNGEDIAQYNADRYVRARGFLKGIIAGIHAADPNAKVAVNNAGWCHYGFMDALWADGVRWDITALHWYAKMGDLEKIGCGGVNVTAIHAAYGRPIWITELNSDIAAETNDAAAQAAWLVQFLHRVTDIAPKYNIQAAFVYELFDEANLTGTQGHYGIVDKDGNPKQALSDLAAELTKQ